MPQEMEGTKFRGAMVRDPLWPEMRSISRASAKDRTLWNGVTGRYKTPRLGSERLVKGLGFILDSGKSLKKKHFLNYVNT